MTNVMHHNAIKITHNFKYHDYGTFAKCKIIYYKIARKRERPETPGA
jgi:hypothetical protein